MHYMLFYSGDPTKGVVIEMTNNKDVHAEGLHAHKENPKEKYSDTDLQDFIAYLKETLYFELKGKNRYYGLCYATQAKKSWIQFRITDLKEVHARDLATNPKDPVSTSYGEGKEIALNSVVEYIIDETESFFR